MNPRLLSITFYQIYRSESTSEGEIELDQRNARGKLEQHVLSPGCMLSQMVPVVTEQNDQGMVGQPIDLQRIHQPADLGIDIRDGGCSLS